MTYLARKQIGQLLRPINPNRVSVNRDGMSHVEAYEIRAHLNRVFGFARWSGEVIDTVQLFEDPHQVPVYGKDRKPTGEMKDVVSVGYRCSYRLTLNAPDGTVLATYTECATGDASNFPVSKRADAHDFAVKTAESQALKRCATNLGDQFGLSLYNKGSHLPLVGSVLAPEPARITTAGPEWADEKPSGEPAGDATEHITSQLAPENPPEPAITNTETPSEAKSTTPAVDPDPGDVKITSLVERALNVPEGKRPRAWLSGLLVEAQRDGLHKRTVADRDGNVMSFEALVQAEIAAAGVKAS